MSENNPYASPNASGAIASSVSPSDSDLSEDAELVREIMESDFVNEKTGYGPLLLLVYFAWILLPMMALKSLVRQASKTV